MNCSSQQIQQQRGTFAITSILIPLRACNAGPRLPASYCWYISLSHLVATEKWAEDQTATRVFKVVCNDWCFQDLAPQVREEEVKQGEKINRVYFAISWKMQEDKKERLQGRKKVEQREVELLTAPVSFPSPASLGPPWTIPWYTDSTQHRCQQQQQQQGHLPGRHARLWSVHRCYSTESRARGSAVPHSAMSHTAVQRHPKQQQHIRLLLGSPRSVSPGPPLQNPRRGSHAHCAQPSSSVIGIILTCPIASQSVIPSLTGR